MDASLSCQHQVQTQTAVVHAIAHALSLVSIDTCFHSIIRCPPGACSHIMLSSFTLVADAQPASDRVTDGHVCGALASGIACAAKHRGMRTLVNAGLGVLLPMGNNAALATGLAAMPFHIVAPFAMQQAGGRAPTWQVLLTNYLNPRPDPCRMRVAAGQCCIIYLATLKRFSNAPIVLSRLCVGRKPVYCSTILIEICCADLLHDRPRASSQAQT